MVVTAVYWRVNCLVKGSHCLSPAAYFLKKVQTNSDIARHPQEFGNLSILCKISQFLNVDNQ